jgi:AAA domain-containing protein
MAIEPQVQASGPSQVTEWRQRWGLHTPATLRLRARELTGAGYLVEGLVPSRSIGLLVGDSGLGKSPLMYQLGICVAAGIPFLGRKTQQGRVVIADFENGIGDVHELIERICRCLGLPGMPSEENLLIWTLNDCPPRFNQIGHTLLDMLRDVKPVLAVIDSLGSYNPEAEEKNSGATRMLQEFRHLARDRGTASVFAHHRRKQSRKEGESVGPLETTIRLREWFQDARGASALVNGSDVRLGVDAPNISATRKDEVALVLRGFGRVRGELGPLYLARVPDENGDPLGYRLLTGHELLLNDEQERAFKVLPVQFAFKDAKSAYGRADQPTRNWLLRSIDLGILTQSGRGMYVKLYPDGAGGGGVGGGEG